MISKNAGEGVIYPELSYSIMQAVFEVHNQLGPGFTEEIYEAALAIELEAQHIPYKCQSPIQVYCKGHALGVYRLDLIVDDKIILELKAVSALADIHRQQLLSYLKATNLRLGILINFGTKKVESTRIVN